MTVANRSARKRAETIHLDAGLRARIARAAVRGYPDETCGILVGRRDAQGTRVERVVAAANVARARSSDRYEIEPEDLLRADQEARRDTREIVGIWHSHPDHPAVPSKTDLARAWPGWSYVIVRVTAWHVREIRSWRLRDGAFEEETLRA